MYNINSILNIFYFILIEQIVGYAFYKDNHFSKKYNFEHFHNILTNIESLVSKNEAGIPYGPITKTVLKSYRFVPVF